MKVTWCQICQCEYKLKELKRWTGGDSLKLLCPDCDDVLVSPDCCECSRSATRGLLYQGKVYYCCDKHYPWAVED